MTKWEGNEEDIAGCTGEVGRSENERKEEGYDWIDNSSITFSFVIYAPLDIIVIL